MKEHHDSRLWLAICVFAVLLLLLVLCGISFGATGPQEYIYRAFVRSHSLSDSSLYVDGSKGDIIRCFSVSLTDTTAGGVDMTYTADVRHNWRFAMPDSAQICDCYEVAGSPDSLLWYHVRLPGKGFRQASNQLTTDAQGRWNPHVSVKVDTLIAGKKITTADLATGAGTIGTTELADSSITAAKIPANSITEAKVGTSAVGTQQLAASGVTSAKILDGTIADADVSSSAAISLSKLSSASASTNNLMGWSGSAWAPTSALSVSTLSVSSTSAHTGAATFAGAVTLGDAAGDAITSTGNFTATGTTTCGDDTTDVTTTRGIPRMPDAIVCGTFDSGTTSDTFTFTNAKAGWHYLAAFQAAGGKAIVSIERTASNTITVTTNSIVSGSVAICIWGWKP